MLVEQRSPVATLDAGCPAEDGPPANPAGDPAAVVAGQVALALDDLDQVEADGRPLYFMVFATDHPAGETIMRSVLEKVETTMRQPSLLPYNQRY